MRARGERSGPLEAVSSRTRAFYTDRILPHLIHYVMRNGELAPYRQRRVGLARGRVLELGIGGGANLPFYSSEVRELIGLDPSSRLLALASQAAAAAGFPVRLLRGTAEAIPLPAASVDAVVATWTLCSVPDLARALAETRRVLRPSGRLIFVEHGLAPEPGVARWQRRLTPAWAVLGGGCRLDRDPPRLLEAHGFRIDDLRQGYMRGPKPMTFISEGLAGRR